MVSILQNISLAPLTTFRVGGKARFFAEVKNESDLRQALGFAKVNKLSVFVLGGGSNTLFFDNGFSGLVLRVVIGGLTAKVIGSRVRVSVGAGYAWDKLVAWAVQYGYSGIENLSLIPGTIGGAVCQNIGAYGVEFKDVVRSVKVLDTRTGRVKNLLASACQFGYRESIFKKDTRYIVLAAELELSKKFKPKLEYPVLRDWFAKRTPILQRVRAAVITIRKSKLPYELNSAGSFFKNPIVAGSKFEKLLAGQANLKGSSHGGGIKLSAGQLIELAGFKGYRRGDVGVSEKHALVLVNYGKAKTRDIVELAEDIQKQVKCKFGVALEPEVRIV